MIDGLVDVPLTDAVEVSDTQQADMSADASADIASDGLGVDGGVFCGAGGGSGGQDAALEGAGGGDANLTDGSSSDAGKLPLQFVATEVLVPGIIISPPVACASKRRGAPRVFHNGCNASKWLSVRLNGKQSNREGVGARVVVKVGKLVLIRDIDAGSNGLWGSSEKVAHFGLGGAAKIVELVVH